MCWRRVCVCVRGKGYIYVCATKWKWCLPKMSVCVCDRERWGEQEWCLFMMCVCERERLREREREQEGLDVERGGVRIAFAHSVWGSVWDAAFCISMLDTQWPCCPMITALWTYEWLYEHPNWTSTSFLMVVECVCVCVCVCGGVWLKCEYILCMASTSNSRRSNATVWSLCRLMHLRLMPSLLEVLLYCSSNESEDGS